jgi:hypothetical protein
VYNSEKACTCTVFHSRVCVHVLLSCRQLVAHEDWPQCPRRMINLAAYQCDNSSHMHM